MNNITIIRRFLQEREVDMSFIRKFLNTRPDSGKKRSIQDLLCRCGVPKKITQKTGKISTYCGKSECWMHYGKKRPKHSEKMKLLAKTTDRLTGLMKKGNLHNKEVNTPLFKKKVLSNKNINFTDEDLEEKYNRYLKSRWENTRGKSYETRLKDVNPCLLELITKKYGKDILLTEEYFKTLEPHLREELYYDIHGILTRYYDKQIKKQRRSKFQRIYIDNLKYNKKVTALYCRSVLEHQWISFFEKNKIQWEYEPFTVNGKYKGTYTPDFLIEWNSYKIVIEVKGTLYGYPEDYIENKLEGCKEYCKTKNYKFLFILNKKPNIKHLTQTQTW